MAPSALALVISGRQNWKNGMGAAAGHPVSQSRPVPLFLANGVLQAADGVLYLALNMVGLAFTFCFWIAGGLAAHSLALPFACSAEPLTRSLSTISRWLNLAIRRKFRRRGCFLRSRPRMAIRVRHKFSIATLPICNEVLFPTVLSGPLERGAVPWGHRPEQVTGV